MYHWCKDCRCLTKFHDLNINKRDIAHANAGTYLIAPSVGLMTWERFLGKSALNRVIAIAAAVCKLLCINGLSYACSVAELGCMKSYGWMISVVAWSYLPYQCFASRDKVYKCTAGVKTVDA